MCWGRESKPDGRRMEWGCLVIVIFKLGLLVIYSGKKAAGRCFDGSGCFRKIAWFLGYDRTVTPKTCPGLTRLEFPAMQGHLCPAIQRLGFCVAAAWQFSLRWGWTTHNSQCLHFIAMALLQDVLICFRFGFTIVERPFQDPKEYLLVVLMS